MASLERTSPRMDSKSLRYFEFHFKFLRFFGVGYFHFPDERNDNNYPTKLYLIYVIISNLFNVVYAISGMMFAWSAWKVGREWSLIFLSLTLTGIQVIATIKIFILIKNNKIVQKIVRVLEVDSKGFKCDESILKESKTFTKIVTGSFFILGEITITGITALSIIENYEKGLKMKASNYTLELQRDPPFTAYVPWESTEDWRFGAEFFYSAFGTYWMGTILIIGDTMIGSIMTHIGGQFKMVQTVMENTGNSALDILENRLNRDFDKDLNYTKINEEVQNNGLNANEVFFLRKQQLMAYFDEEDFNLAMIDCLKKAIQYHQLILEITDDLQQAYNQAFFCQTLSSLYVIGLLLVQSAMNLTNISSMKFYNMIGFLLSILCQLFIQTYTANEIKLEAEKVYKSAYSCHWYCSDKRTAKLLGIILHKAQRPVTLTAGKFGAMSNDLFVSIIKISYQLFTVIMSTMNRNKSK